MNDALAQVSALWAELYARFSREELDRRAAQAAEEEAKRAG